ncbi:MAG: DUF4097 family beta strand repeat-containing protein [Pseudomonadota bacterium]
MIAIFALLPCAFAAHPVDRSAEAAPDATVSLENTCGSLSVAAWDKPLLQVSGNLEEDDDVLVLTGSGARLHLEVKDSHGGDTGCAALLVRLPAGVRLEAETVSATLEVAGLTGTLDLDTVSGNLRLQGTPGAATLESVSGEIEIRGAASSLDLETVSGNITVGKALGRLDAETVSGDLTIEGGPFDRIELSTVSGDVLLSGPLTPSGRAEISAHSGDVTLRPLHGLPATYDLSTFSGDVIGAPSSLRIKDFTGNRVRWTEGTGTATVEVETHSGDINIEAQ